MTEPPGTRWSLPDCLTGPWFPLSTTQERFMPRFGEAECIAAQMAAQHGHRSARRLLLLINTCISCVLMRMEIFTWLLLLITPGRKEIPPCLSSKADCTSWSADHGRNFLQDLKPCLVHAAPVWLRTIT